MRANYDCNLTHFSKDSSMSQDNAQQVETTSNFEKKLDGFFKISQRGSSVRTEMIAGLTTF